MNFASKDLSIIWKAGIAVIAIFIFIKVLPLAVMAGVIIFIALKLINYFKGRKKVNKRKKYEQPYKESYHDFSGKKVIDVDYDEVSK